MQNLNLHKRIAVFEEMSGQLPTIPAAVTDNLNPADVARHDRLVYELYDLTEEEIAIVEEHDA